MKRPICWWCIGLVIVLTVLYAAVVHASTIKGNPEACVFWGHQMQNLTLMRDNGVTWADIEQEFNKTTSEALGKKGSLLQDADDLKYVTEDAKAVWGELKDKNATEVFVWTVQKCMAQNRKTL